MTRAELIAILAGYPDDALITMPSDDQDGDLIYSEVTEMKELDADDGDLGFVQKQVYEHLSSGGVVLVLDHGFDG